MLGLVTSEAKFLPVKQMRMLVVFLHTSFHLGNILQSQ